MKATFTMTDEQADAVIRDLSAYREREVAVWKRLHEVLEEMREIGFTCSGAVPHWAGEIQSCPFCKPEES
jgi:hypothetical protein